MSVVAPAGDDTSIKLPQAIESMTGASVSEFAGPPAAASCVFLCRNLLDEGATAHAVGLASARFCHGAD